MMLEPEPGSLDAETLKPLLFKFEGEEEWRETTESEVLDAFREARVPSSTLFRRGDGPPRTMGTLVSWNGRECPFADFSEPARRERVRERRSVESASGASMDENQNLVGRVREEGRAAEEQGSVFARFVAYMDGIQERMASIEKMHTEQQSRLAGAEIFMKKVASLDERIKTCEASLKALDRRSQEAHEFIFFGNRGPLGQSGRSGSIHGAEIDEMFAATKKMHKECVETSNDLKAFKEEVHRVHAKEMELDKQLEVVDGRYAQLVVLLAAHERNRDVREALDEWNAEQKQKAQEAARPRSPESLQQAFGFGKPVARPQATNALGHVSEANKLDWRALQIEAERNEQQQTAIRQMRSQLPDTTAGRHVLWLLLGKENSVVEGDREATPGSMQKLSQTGTLLTSHIGTKLSDYMGNPRFHCFCGANLQSGISVITHFNTAKHLKVRPHRVFQSVVDYWLETVSRLKAGPRAYVPTL